MVGTTPAHAGKTLRACPSPWKSGDHPRACGEDTTYADQIAGVWGPPPRMRGRRCVRALRPGSRGTTPAHAGKTRTITRALSIPSDHPRACGEDFVKTYSSAPDRGPPPRMRGRHRCRRGKSRRRGTTPAHAGKTSPIPCCWWPSGDHPRACGEDTR